jgi:hypothetical protein
MIILLSSPQRAWKTLRHQKTCNFDQVLRISIEQLPIANLDHPFAFSNIAGAKGCYRLPIGDC